MAQSVHSLHESSYGSGIFQPECFENKKHLVVIRPLPAFSNQLQLQPIKQDFKATKASEQLPQPGVDKSEHEFDSDAEWQLPQTEDSQELRIHCQNASLLKPDDLIAQAQLMQQSRSKLSNLLINNDQGLLAIAHQFIENINNGIDLSEIVNRNSNDMRDPVQNETFVQDTVKQVEIKLLDAFSDFIENYQDSSDGLCRSLVDELHFLPNFLRQTVERLDQQFCDQNIDDELLFWSEELNQNLSIMMQSRQEMINGNLRLVTFIAKQYKNQSIQFTDLIQEGTIGLIKAVDRFDWTRAVRFSTYAIYWIRQTISRAMVRQDKLVRLPFNMAAKASAVFEVMNTYLLQNNRWPSHETLSELCNLPVAEIKAIVNNYQPVVSVDRNINDDDELPELVTTLEQNHFPMPLNTLINSALKNLLRTAIKTLPEREADIINCRFGLDNDHEMTLQDIADNMSLTRERVRQIQNSALQKLKNNFNKDLVVFLEQN